MAQNYASRYASKVDERFSQESQFGMATSGGYEFTGVKTVNVYSIDTVDLTNYSRTGTNRYGTPSELGNETRELTVRMDRAFTYTIDRGNKVQSAMVMDAGTSLSRQLREKVVPEYDTYGFYILATEAGGQSATTVTKANAYEEFLKAQEALGNASVPLTGRICFASYAFYNFLKLDSSFVKEGNSSQEMLRKGILGTVDGVRIVLVPRDRLPSKTTGTTKTGADFILTHPSACVAPRQLQSYKTHDNPPGINGWLVEGRELYDAFVLNNKKDAIFYHGPANPTKPAFITW